VTRAWLALGLVLLACGPGARSAPAAPVAPGTPVTLVLPLVDGGDLDLTTLRGHWVALSFVATWSLDAGDDVAELRAARDTLGKDTLDVVSVALDPQGYKLVAPWRAANHIDWFVALSTPELRSGESAIGQAVAVVPTTVLLGPDGTVMASWRGPLPKGAIVRAVRGGK
jgi:hypothetical protein